VRFPAYEQAAWVRCQDYASAAWTRLIDLWESYNEHLAHLISRIPGARLTTLCRIGDRDAVTLGCLVEDYVGHLEHHLAQLERR
jgi:hypothetical protein